MNLIKNIYVLLAIIFFAISCEDIIFEQDISEYNINILAPHNEASVVSGYISFNWEPVSDADKYQIQIAIPNFENAIQIILDSSISNTSFSKQLLANNYEWRIRALNSAFETSYFTNILLVTEVEDFVDKEVELLSPANNLISNQTTQNLAWKSVEGATEYRLQVWQPDNSGNVEDDAVISLTNVQYTFLNGYYTWQVRAQNDTQNTLYFSRTLLIDTTVPNTPDLLTPSDNETIATGKVSFTWKREDIVGSVESDSIYVFSDTDLKTLVFKDRSTNKQYEKELTTGHHYWYVQSFDEAGNQSSNSSVFYFYLN